MSSESHGSTKVVLTALTINVSIAIIKGIAAFLSGSASMLAETIHSFVDCGNQIFLLIGFKRSEMKANQNHPLGHHREIYFWSFVVAIALFLGGGIASIRDGLDKIHHPEPMAMIHMLGYTMPSWYLNVSILLISALMEGKGFFLAYNSMAVKKGQSPFKALLRSKDPGLFVVMFEDGAALIGLSIAFIFTIMSIMFHMPVLDGVASVLIGCMLLGVSFVLGNETRSLLIGESNPEIEKFAREQAVQVPGVVGVNEVVSEQRGPNSVIVLLSLDWNDSVLAGIVERNVANLEKTIKASFPCVKRVFIEVQDKRDHVLDVSSDANMI